MIHRNELAVKSLGIDTYRENIIFMRADCHICMSEGFTALTRLVISHGSKKIIATLNVVEEGWLKETEAGLSDIAFKRLGIKDGDIIRVSHLMPIASLKNVRAKMYRSKLDEKAFHEIISDITAGLYSDIELAAFIAACSGDNMDLDEITSLTKAMIETGSRLSWNKNVVLDKHSVGGLPGNRTTPIVIPIVAAAGLTIPKTSSRAITSPAGTADTMETITNVNLTMDDIRRVVNNENGCIAWGGNVKLSPADDILISIERALDVDSAGQMIASVLSKKASAGSTHVVIDIPVGETAKVRTQEEALKLQYYFSAVGNAIGLHTEVLITDGSQPVGRGIGPALEAMDILSVLRNEENAPADLRDKSIQIAATLIKMSGKAEKEATEIATELLASGKAYRKFENICKAQGSFKEPVYSKFKVDIKSLSSGVVKVIDNRRLAKIAKLAGAPKHPSAGIYFNTPLGTKVEKGQTLYTIYAEAEGELHYTTEYIKTSGQIFIIN